MATPNSSTAARIRPRGSTVTTRDRIAGTLRRHFGLRIHTSILLLWSFSAGLLTTKGLLALGVHSMFWRYTFAVVVAYGAFLIGVRIWLAYVGVPAGGDDGGGVGSVGSNRSARPSRDGGNSGTIDIPDISLGRGSSGSIFSGKGGGSGGGGASSSFDGPASPPSSLLALDSGGVNSGDSGGALSGIGDAAKGLGDIGGMGDLGGDGDGCLIAFAVMVVAGLLVAAIGAAFFVISLGPEILIDAAFSALLTGGLIRAGRRMDQPGWIGSVFKATWLPFVIVLVSLWIFAGAAAVLTPQANTFAGVWQIVWPKLLEAI